MASEAVGVASRVALLFACVASACLPAAARAQETTFRLAVCTSSAQDRFLLSHVQGQLSDVAVEIVPVKIELTPNPAPVPFDAERVAHENDVHAVMWFERTTKPARSLVVQLWAAGTGVLPPRTVEVVPPQAGARGADILETAALVARSSVSALVRAHRDRELAMIAAGPAPLPPPGGTGAPAIRATATPSAAPPAATPPTQLAAPSAPAATSKPKPAQPAAAVEANVRAPEPAPKPRVAERDSDEDARAEREADEQRESAEAGAEGAAEPPTDATYADAADSAGPIRLQPRFFVGLQSVVDGVSSIGQHSITARFGYQLEHFGLHVFASTGIGSHVSDAFVDLHLTRHAAGLALDAETRLHGVLYGAAGVHAGAAFYMRSSTAKDARIERTGSALVTALVVGPEVALELRSGWWGLGLHVALDVMPDAPTFQVETPAGEAPAPHLPWALEPRISLGMEGRL